MLMSTFMASVEGTVVTTAMPTIVARLNDLGLFSWVFGAYLLTQAVTTPIYGRLADMFGRRLIFLASTALFLAGSVLCGFAWNMDSLILFRGLQGLGGGGLVPVALTVIADVSKPADRPRMLGYVSAVWGFSAIVGPLMGTVLVNGPGWPFVFWINVPIGLVTMFMVTSFLSEPTSIGRRLLIDWWGAGSLFIGVGLIMVVLVQISALSQLVIACGLGLGTAALAGFLWREYWGGTPLFAGYLLRRPTILISILSALMCGALLLGTTGFLPIWVKGVAGGGPSEAGMVVGIITLSWTIANVCVGRTMSRLRYRPLAICASVVLVIGCGGLLFLDTHYNMVLFGLSALIGAGLGVNTLVFTVATQSSVNIQERGRATALFFFSRITGQALGAALFGSMLNSALGRNGSPTTDVLAHALRSANAEYSPDILAIGFQRVFALATAIALGMLLASLFVPSSDRLPIYPVG